MCTFRFPGYYYCLPTFPFSRAPPKKRGLNTPEQQSQESTSSSKQFRIVARKNKNQPRIIIKKTRTVPQAEAVAQKRIRQCSRRYSTRPKSQKRNNFKRESSLALVLAPKKLVRLRVAACSVSFSCQTKFVQCVAAFCSEIPQRRRQRELLLSGSLRGGGYRFSPLSSRIVPLVVVSNRIVVAQRKFLISCVT